MELNENQKIYLREKIENLVRSIPEGQQIQLPLEMLDDLIFLKIKDKDAGIVKFPIWTGKFLRKIDLSKLSFINVFMQDEIDSLNGFYDSLELSKFKKMNEFSFKLPFINSSYDKYPIDFSYTNINIDFSKLYYKEVKNVNFEGVDLSKSNILSLQYIKNCNFSNTNIIKFPILDYSYGDTNFSNNDFSAFEMDLLDYLSNIGFREGNSPSFFNTKINFKFDYSISNDWYIEELKLYLDSGLLYGCYINGKLINSNETSVIDNNSLLSINDNDLLTIINDIDNQIKGFNGK